MKHLFSLFIFIMFILSYNNSLYAQKNAKIKPTEINSIEFKNLIWDFGENEGNFIYKGKKTAIINFYSPQSSNYKVSMSILDELEREYKGKLDIYKINAEQEKELIELFQIKDYPTFLFITKKGEPQTYVGFKTKAQLSQLIDFAISK